MDISRTLGFFKTAIAAALAATSLTPASAQDASGADGADAAEIPNPEFAGFDSFLTSFRVEKKIPALSAVILRDGEIVWQKAYGYSDDEGEFPTTPDTTFDIASVTKPIAATAILTESEAGRIGLDTPLSQDKDWTDFCAWLSTTDIPFGGGGMDNDGTVIAPLNCARNLTLTDILNMRVNGEKGDRFVYNPITYARIDRVIEGAGGRPLRNIVRDNVITPAGMRDVALGWRDPSGEGALRLMAHPYKIVDGRPQKNSFADDDFRAAAGIYASTTALAKFDQALDSDKLLNRAWYNVIFSKNNIPAAGDYHLGWFAQDWNGKHLYWHSGWNEDRGSALYLKIPEERLTLIVLANAEGLWWGNSLIRAEIHNSPVARYFLENIAN